jgi:oligopeptide/dipeptide ABC transporter ATP-binding protein
MVMYLGQVVEACSSDDLYREPLHPYTRVLLSSIPKTNPDERASDDVPFGEIPSPLNPPSGCRFRTRCPRVMDVCAGERPAMRQPTPGHAVSCYLYETATGTEVPIHA